MRTSKVLIGVAALLLLGSDARAQSDSKEPSAVISGKVTIEGVPAAGVPVLLLKSINSSEAPLSGDNGALVLTMIWGMALVLVSAAGTVAASRWSPWLAYLAAAPPALAVLWNLYQSLAALLPNVY